MIEDDLLRLPRAGFADAVISPAFEELAAASECIIILERAVGLLQRHELPYAKCPADDDEATNHGYEDLSSSEHEYSM